MLSSICLERYEREVMSSELFLAIGESCSSFSLPRFFSELKLFSFS